MDFCASILWAVKRQRYYEILSFWYSLIFHVFAPASQSPHLEVLTPRVKEAPFEKSGLTNHCFGHVCFWKTFEFILFFVAYRVISCFKKMSDEQNGTLQKVGPQRPPSALLRHAQEKSQALFRPPKGTQADGAVVQLPTQLSPALWRYLSSLATLVSKFSVSMVSTATKFNCNMPPSKKWAPDVLVMQVSVGRPAQRHHLADSGLVPGGVHLRILRSWSRKKGLARKHLKKKTEKTRRMVQNPEKKFFSRKAKITCCRSAVSISTFEKEVQTVVVPLLPLRKPNTWPVVVCCRAVHKKFDPAPHRRQQRIPIHVSRPEP